MGIFDESEFCVDRDLNFEISERYFALAEDAKQEGDFQRAAIIMEEAIRFRPYNGERHFLAGKAQMEAIMTSKAIKSFETAIHLDPSIIDVYDQLGE